MSSGTRFQVIANAGSLDRSGAEALRRAVERAFDVDLGALVDAFLGAGVCVEESQTFPGARQAVRTLRHLGADAFIVDSMGRTVPDTLSPPAPGTAAPAPRREAREVRPRQEAVSEAPRPEEEGRTDALGLGGLVALGGDALPGAAPVQDGPHARQIPPGPQDDDSFGELELVLATGPVEPGALKPAAEARPGRRRPRLSTLDLDPDDLELDRPPDGRPPSWEEEPPIELVQPPARPSGSEVTEDGVTRGGAAAEMARGTWDSPGEVERGEGSAGGPEQPRPQNEATQPVDPPSGERGVGQRRGTWSARRKGRRRIFPLMKGHLRSRRPRLRLVLALAVSLLLGGVLPALHARRTRATAIDPLVQELANVRAHGKVLSRLSSFRGAKELQEIISGNRRRGMMATALLWFALAGGLTGLWLRIT